MATRPPYHRVTAGRLGLAASPADLDAVLRRAADLRARLPRLDGIALAREARADLEMRGA